MRESDLRRKMIDRILDCGLPARARSVHAGPHSGSVGEPDIDAVVGGFPVKIEVKLPGNRPTPLQLRVMRQWAEAGAITGWAFDMDGLEEILDHVRRRHALVTEALRESLHDSRDLWEGDPWISSLMT